MSKKGLAATSIIQVPIGDLIPYANNARTHSDAPSVAAVVLNQ